MELSGVFFVSSFTFLVLLGLGFDLPPVDYRMEGHTGVMGWAG
jgi:hypothetical protein